MYTYDTCILVREVARTRNERMIRVFEIVHSRYQWGTLFVHNRSRARLFASAFVSPRISYLKSVRLFIYSSVHQLQIHLAYIYIQSIRPSIGDYPFVVLVHRCTRSHIHTRWIYLVEGT